MKMGSSLKNSFRCAWLQNSLASFSLKNLLNVALRLHNRRFFSCGLAIKFFAQARLKTIFQAASLFIAWGFIFTRTVIADLSLDYTYEPANEPLTTEAVWRLDPGELNPHLRTWLVSRSVELVGLKVIQLKKGGYGVTADGIRSKTQYYVRGSGPWFQALTRFPCTETPVYGFADPQGAKIGGDRAAESWKEALSNGKIKLDAIFRTISGDAPGTVLESGRELFSQWLEALDSDWRETGYRRAIDAEWKYYRDQASQICVHRKTKLEIPLEAVMEQPPVLSQEELGARMPQMRAPARRWDGAYSIRLNLTFAGRKLNGQFLIDSTQPRSLISPHFLDNQGVLVETVEDPTIPPERFGKTLAKTARLDSVELAATKIQLTDFLVVPTEIYSTPDHFAGCCDGILGNDFLRKYAVEFHPGTIKLSEVLFWPRKDYVQKGDVVWGEVTLLSQGSVESGCRVQSSSDQLLAGLVKWSTAGKDSLQISSPKRTRFASVHCDDFDLGKKLETSAPETGHGAIVGADTLGRGDFTLDLGNGRIWFDRKSLEKIPRTNDTGLDLVYDYDGFERVLIVDKIRAGSSGAKLQKQSLNVGDVVTSVDGKPAEDMDTWEVNQHLAGEYGDSVKIEWKAKRGIRAAVLNLK